MKNKKIMFLFMYLVLFVNTIEIKAEPLVFTLPDQFLVSDLTNMNWQHDMIFEETRNFKKIIVDVDFYHGGWHGRTNDDTTNYGGGDYYCVFWLNSGKQWSDAIAYLNLISPGGKLENQSNMGGYWNPSSNQFGLRLSTGCPVVPDHNYHVHYEYDTESSTQRFSLLENDVEICATAGLAGLSSQIETSSMFIQFGSQYSPEGPEGATLGWKFSNFKIEFIDNTSTPKPGVIGFSAESFSVLENGSNANISVSRIDGVDGEVSVLYTTDSKSAISEVDYNPVSGRLFWAEGESGIRTFQIPILDDTDADGNKTVDLSLQNIQGESNLGLNTAQLLITDNEYVTCTSSETVLCLGVDNRFEIKVQWEDFVGKKDDARSVKIGTQDSGLFYFFDPNNIEMLFKILNGCDINGHFWVFFAATTNVGYNVQVRDTVTNLKKSYSNAIGTVAMPVQDIEFEICM